VKERPTVARFIRDEKKTFPFLWLTAGGLFAASSVWAVYAELVTRVPWQEHQDAFFDMELEQAKESLSRAEGQWKQELEPALKDRLARKAALEESQKSGEYKQAADRLAQLKLDFAKAEEGKTFGGSDLDEAYYYRNLAEYERDAAAVAARKALKAVLGDDKANQLADQIYADPSAPPKGEQTKAMHHLETEIARMTAHVAQIDKALSSVPEGAQQALRHSREAEEHVITSLKAEVKHQTRVDEALTAMGRIEGPADARSTAKDPVKAAEEKAKLRAEACKGHEDTRNCIQWLKLEPVDLELKAIEVEISKARRTLSDAELRAQKADDRANPKFNPENLIQSLVGPFQIVQVVTSWIEYDRDVDKEQVDRCQTCHMGADAGTYTSAAIAPQFRTHPHRGTLFSTHPIETFGCTSCHQGQGRATDELSHSGWKLEEKHGKERWHFEGDHYWEDPILPIGALTRVVVDDLNDELQVKINKSKWITIQIDHRSPEAHAQAPETPEEYATSDELFGVLQEKLAKVLADEAPDLKAKWHAVVREVDHRVEIGLDANNPSEHISAKDRPSFGLKFTKPETARMLGFGGGGEFTEKLPVQVATLPPSVPIRGEAMPKFDADGRFHPPKGAEGLQVPDEMRNRFIVSLPEVEAGCLRCHKDDVDLKPRRSAAKYTTAKLEREKAEAAQKKDPKAYKESHGSDELPAVAPDPEAALDPVPTFDEGRALFRKLNCTGCHILDNFPWDRNAGPALDNITAKVEPQWLLTWLRNPRGWRAKTRMPNLWPKPLDPASKRPYAETSPEYQRWADQMREETVAIASYLVERSDKPATRPGAAKDSHPLKAAVTGYAEVEGATPEKGKLLFEAYGCQGCHARSDKDAASEKLPEPWRSRERDIAPSLSNLGAKTTADWIAYWVEEPSRYWHGTKMPSLRLSRVEAASIGKYVASLKEAPLDPAQVEASEVTLVTDAAKRAERVPCKNQGGALMTRVECGEKLIGYYGCFGCHDIAGFDKSAPIAPELGGFAKKDVTTLDFGYAIADHHMQTTETFATLKLDSPRIYRRDRIELKMADYDLSPREIRSLVVFLKGLVPNRPKPAFNPAAKESYAAAVAGRQLVEDLNCRACHVIEGRGADIDQFRSAQLATDTQARAPYLNGEGMRVQPEWLFSFLRAPGDHGIRPWLHPEWAWGENVPDDKKALRMPTFNLSSEQVTAIVRYFASWDGQEYPYQTPQVRELSDEQKLYALTHMNAADAANCLSCHFQGTFPVERGQSELAKMAPNLNLVQKRLRPEWVKEWLLRPQNWLPYTKMTAFWASTDRPKDAANWPSESDPFLSPAPAWNHIPSFPAVTGEEQVEMVRDFLFGLPPDAVFPRAGEEAGSPLVTKPTLAMPAEGDKEEKKDAKGKAAAPKRTGQAPGPARM
jgi:cytochrome c2